MSYKLLFLLLICLHCAAGKKNTNRHADQSAADLWIRKTLFAGSTKNCLKITVPSKVGQAATTTEPTWAVAVLKKIHRPRETISLLHCTGSLIHPQVVLTAAHCFQNTSTDALVVLGGAASNENSIREKHQQTRHVDSVVIHENYTSDSMGNDIALIFLKEPFTLNKFVGYICLTPRFDTRTNTNCSLSSWDLNSRNATGYPQLTTFDTTAISSRKCQRVLQLTSLGKELKMPKDTICIGGGLNNTAVWGNGGAALVCPICHRKQHYVQIGVLSFGFETNALPSVLTNVVMHRKWIRSTCTKRHFKVHTCLNKNKFLRDD